MNTLSEALKGKHEEMKIWMEEMHSNPELSMHEQNTAKYIANLVKSFGEYELVEGVGKYGMVASLKVGKGNKVIGLRAEFDALPIQEDNDLRYKSQIPGKSHLCGHDGHTTMMLGAAKYLAETKNFNGTVRIFFHFCESKKF